MLYPNIKFCFYPMFCPKYLLNISPHALPHTPFLIPPHILPHVLTSHLTPSYTPYFLLPHLLPHIYNTPTITPCFAWCIPPQLLPQPIFYPIISRPIFHPMFFKSTFHLLQDKNKARFKPRLKFSLILFTSALVVYVNILAPVCAKRCTCSDIANCFCNCFV